MSTFKKAERKNAFLREEWRSAPGFPGYEISSFGEVRSLKPGRYFGHVLNQQTTKYGYRKVGLHIEGNVFYPTVHRLVALALIPRIISKDHVNHIDCDKTNNRPGNLEWMTRKENADHARRHGRYAPTTGENHWTAREPWRRKTGERNGRAVLNSQQVREIRSSSEPVRALVEKYGVCKQTIHAILKGKIWKELGA